METYCYHFLWISLRCRFDFDAKTAPMQVGAVFRTAKARQAMGRQINSGRAIWHFVQFALCALLVAVLAGGMLRLVVRAADRVERSDLQSLAISVQDDSYYYLLPAYQFKTYGFYTFDGIHNAYGFQPGYELCLTLLALFFDNRIAFFKSAIFISYIIYGAIACMLYLVLLRVLEKSSPVFRHVGGCLGACLFLCNLAVMYSYTTVKENGLFVLLLAFAIWQLLPALRSVEIGVTKRRACVLGLTIGLMLLTRLTPASVLIACTLAGAWMLLDRAHKGILLVSMAVPVACWSLFAVCSFGSVMPMSGKVKTLGLVSNWSLSHYFTLDPNLFVFWYVYIRRIVQYSLGHPAFPLPQYSIAAPPLETILIQRYDIMCGLAIVFFLLNIRLWLSMPRLRLILGLLLASFAGATATLLVFSQNTGLLGQLPYFSWYVADAPFMIAVIVPAALFSWSPAKKPSFEGFRREGRVVRDVLVGCLAALILGCSVWDALGKIEPWPRFSFDESRLDHVTVTAAFDMRESNIFMPTDRVGSYNAGILGYFLPATVVNLDGLANDDIYYSVLREHGRLFDSKAIANAMYEYVKTNGITYVCDLLPLPPGDNGYFGNVFAHYDVVRMYPFRYGPGFGYCCARVTQDAFPEFRTTAGRVLIAPYREMRLPDGRKTPCLRNIVLDCHTSLAGRVEFDLHGAYQKARMTVCAIGECAGAWQLIVNVDGSETTMPVLVMAGTQDIELPLASAWSLSITFTNQVASTNMKPSCEIATFGWAFEPAVSNYAYKP